MQQRQLPTQLSAEQILSAKKFALNIRIETLNMLGHLGFGHVGGSLSIADLLAVLYGQVMRVRPNEPNWSERDWLICSKGHAGPAVYSALALKGFFPIKDLLTLNVPGTKLPSHCDRLKTPGVDMTTGSLGQGISQAMGIATGNRLDKRDSQVYCIIGDGESQEGQVWEALMYGSHQKLSNITIFLDNNKMQLDGYLKDINDMGDFAQKVRSFGYYVEDVNGHDVEALYRCVAQGVNRTPGDLPHAYIMDTVKAKGMPSIENTEDNHHIVIKPEVLEKELARLKLELEGLGA